MGRHEAFPTEAGTFSGRSTLFDLPLFPVLGAVAAIGLAMAGAPLFAGPDPALPPPIVEQAPAYQGRLLDSVPARTAKPVEPGIVRVRGRLDQSLNDAMAAAGVEPSVATAFVQTIAERSRGLDIAADDHFDLVADMAGEGGPRLVYAALDRVGASDVELVRLDGRWIAADADAAEAQRKPVNGRVTSRFGSRVHPILGYSRMHKGIDFAAAMGQPVVAAQAGRITGAGWAGGYGRQVRIAHGSGLVSSYSHLSRIAVGLSSHVHAGQLIGYAGSSGLSTGPHVHYEVRLNGRPVDPNGTRLQGGSALSPATAAAVKARLDTLLRIAPRQRG